MINDYERVRIMKTIQLLLATLLTQSIALSADISMATSEALENQGNDKLYFAEEDNQIDSITPEQIQADVTPDSSQASDSSVSTGSSETAGLNTSTEDTASTDATPDSSQQSDATGSTESTEAKKSVPPLASFDLKEIERLQNKAQDEQMDAFMGRSGNELTPEERTKIRDFDAAKAADRKAQ